MRASCWSTPHASELLEYATSSELLEYATSSELLEYATSSELLEYATSERGGTAASSASVIDGPGAERRAGMKLCRGEGSSKEAAHGGDTSA
jgi:hypothetical protein